MIVVDASVALKWFLPHEPFSEAALALWTAHQEGQQPCGGPELLLYEVSNVLVTKSHLSVEEALVGAKVLMDAELLIYPMKELDYQLAITLARQFGLSFYDATYVALAKTLKCRMITADQKLYQKLHHLKWMMSLGP